MGKKQRAKNPALRVTVTITMAEHDGVTADINTELHVDGEAWMVEAIQAAAECGSLHSSFDALARDVLRPIGEVDRAARAFALGMQSSKVARA